MPYRIVVARPLAGFRAFWNAAALRVATSVDP
jgi:hypothetical protein